MFSVKILTANPEMFPGVLNYSIIGKALKEKKWHLEVVNLHDYGVDKRKSIDDSPFGGGPGMIIRPDVIEKAINDIRKNSNKRNCYIYMSPSGKTLKQTDLVKYSKFEEIIVLCGKFEGVDARAINILGFILMIGGGSDNPNEFDASELFSHRRITIAPILLVIGYIIIAYAIMKKEKVNSK